MRAELGVLSIDSRESLRSPWLELLIVVVLVISTLSVVGRSEVSAYILVSHYMGSAAIASIIYMAMLSGSLASSLEQGYGATLLQIRAGRLGIGLGIFLSRVMVPITLLLGSSLLGLILLLWDRMGMLWREALVNYLSTYIMLVGYGSAFMLASLSTKSPAKAILISLILYLAAGMGGEALVFLHRPFLEL